MPHTSLITALADECKLRGFSPKTFQSYASWTRLYYRHHRQPPRQLGAPAVREFLVHLARRGYSASSQNQALNALVFVYEQVLRLPLGEIGSFQRAKKSRYIPVVLSQAEVRRLLEHLEGKFHLMAGLLYGSGLRLNECCQLRIQDVDFDHKRIIVRRGKGGKDRRTVLPDSMIEPLHDQFRLRQAQYLQDLARNTGLAPLPDRFKFKHPMAERDFRWQFLFASQVIRGRHRWHCGDSQLQAAVRQAAQRATIHKRVGCHTLRHSFATHLLQNGTDIREVQELPGHSDVRTTMIYLHVKTQSSLKSPLEKLDHGHLTAPARSCRPEAAALGQPGFPLTPHLVPSWSTPMPQ